MSKKVLIVFICLVLTISLFSIGYAAWQKELRMFGSVTIKQNPDQILKYEELIQQQIALEEQRMIEEQKLLEEQKQIPYKIGVDDPEEAPIITSQPEADVLPVSSGESVLVELTTNEVETIPSNVPNPIQTPEPNSQESDTQGALNNSRELLNETDNKSVLNANDVESHGDTMESDLP